MIKDGRSSPGCIVGPLDRSRKIEGGFSVQIRAPGVSRPEVVQRLPGGLGAFTALPVRVSLLDKSGAVPKRFPIVVDGAPKHPVIDGVTSAEPFISVVFPKAWLSPGMVIHAERSVIGTDGVRITSQTTCAITEGDVAKWR